MQKSHPKVVNPRDIAGERKKTPKKPNKPKTRNVASHRTGSPTHYRLSCSGPLARVLFPFPQNFLGHEYKQRSSLCTHAIHLTDSKDPDIHHVLEGWMRQQKHTQHAPSTKMECDCLCGWIENGRIRKNLIQNGEPQRSSWVRRRRKEVRVNLNHWP